MINSVKIKNFKCIKNNNFYLKKLNILAGLNGMGKSSFTDALLCIGQSELGHIFSKILPLNEKYTNLGTGKDVLYQFAEDELINFDVEMEAENKLALTLISQTDKDTLSIMLPRGITKAQKKVKHKNSIDENIYLLGVIREIQRIRASIHYLTASRVSPQSLHLKSRAVIDANRLGIHGEFTAHYLAEHDKDVITYFNLKHPKAQSSGLLELVNAWMGEISPSIRINVEEVAGVDMVKMDMQYLQPSLGYTNRFRPTHVGFGISYALPVVTALLSAKKGDLIIIDSPESHVHPRGQAVIGKLAALVAENGVQVVLETHSDHIINGVRVAAKEGDIDPSETAIFYFDRETTDKEQYAKITNISIDRQGELSCYPEGLLSEWSNQLLRLL